MKLDAELPPLSNQRLRYAHQGGLHHALAMAVSSYTGYDHRSAQCMTG